MRHTLHSHIIYLENKIQSLRDSLTRHRLSPSEFKELEQQISLAELALARYREAYEIETSLSSPDPSDSGTQSGDGTGNADTSNSDKKRGRAAIAGVKTRAKRLPSFPGYGSTSDHLPQLRLAGIIRG